MTFKLLNGNVLTMTTIKFKNRILNQVHQSEETIRRKLESGELTHERVNKLSKELDMNFEEWTRFQELKSNASGSILSPDEAQTIYAYLGNTLETFNNQPVAVKATCTQVFKELLDRRITRYKMV